MQSPIHAFISSLEVSLSTVFPAADISFDGQNLTVFFKRSDLDGDFVHFLVDLTCMEEEDAGSVAVHARPDHIFRPHWIVEDGERTLVLSNGQRFTGGDFEHSGEYPDGYGNTGWYFSFPQDEELISTLFVGLAEISAVFFAL